jgi:hypothetical protein
MLNRIALAATIHDPDGKLVDAIARDAAALKSVFGIFAINATVATDPRVIEAVKRELGAEVITHKTGECPIAQARRDAVELAWQHGGETILHSDFDHIIRWIEDKPEELRQILITQPDVDFLVVGRSARAFAAGPQRLQQTETLVNHIFSLITGETWDLMFAVRRFNRKAAELIVSHSRSRDLANDVEWPLLARQLGLSTGYAAADGLTYRTMEDFGAATDTQDADPAEWIRRVRIADEHSQTMLHMLAEENQGLSGKSTPKIPLCTFLEGHSPKILNFSLDRDGRSVILAQSPQLRRKLTASLNLSSRPQRSGGPGPIHPHRQPCNTTHLARWVPALRCAALHYGRDDNVCGLWRNSRALFGV